MLQGPTFIPQNMKYAVILCHGYGSNGDDMASLAAHLSPIFPETGFFCPNAPTPLFYGGYEWFSLSDYSGAPEMADQNFLNTLVGRCKEPAKLLSNYIEYLKKTYGLDDANIILGGFSQGGLMALYTGLTGPHQVGGIIGCSAVPIVFGKNLPIESVNHTPPVLLTHGCADDVVPVHATHITSAELQKVHIIPSVKLSSDLTHGINDFCLQEITTFISNIFSKN